jgi:hypothetical protein
LVVIAPIHAGEPIDRLAWPRPTHGHARRPHGAAGVDWSIGSGDEVSGPIRGLLLLLTGRTSTAAPLLSGYGVTKLVHSSA